jgi:hypothetical protein
MTDRRLRSLEQLAAAEGLTVLSVGVSGGSHFKLRARAADGREESFFAAFSPSDRRSHINCRALFRRFARGQTTKTERTS